MRPREGPDVLALEQHLRLHRIERLNARAALRARPEGKSCRWIGASVGPLLAKSYIASAGEGGEPGVGGRLHLDMDCPRLVVRRCGAGLCTRAAS